MQKEKKVSKIRPQIPRPKKAVSSRRGLRGGLVFLRLSALVHCVGVSSPFLAILNSAAIFMPFAFVFLRGVFCMYTVTPLEPGLICPMTS